MALPYSWICRALCVAWLPLLTLSILVFSSVSCLSGDAPQVSPWSNIAVLPASREDLNMMPYLSNDPEVFAEIPSLETQFEKGDTQAARLLGNLHRKKKDIAPAMRWYRTAVRHGDVTAAIIMGGMFFPPYRRDGRDFEVVPDIVNAYCWLAIGLAGLNPGAHSPELIQAARERAPAPYEEEDMRGILADIAERVSNELITLDLLLLPSERARAREILAGWPDELPPDIAEGPVPFEAKIPAIAIDGNSYFLDLYLKVIRGRPIGKTGTRILQSIEKDEQMEEQRKDLFRMAREAAGSGDSDAAYLIAYCRLHGLGTEKDVEKALPYIREQAAKGFPRAYYDLAVAVAMEDVGNREEKEEEVFANFLKSAEAGHMHAMPLVSAYYREKRDDDRAEEWMEKAVAAGYDELIMERLEMAEARRDARDLAKWITIFILRAGSPQEAYVGHMMFAYVVDAMTPEELKAAEAEGERWHVEHPRPAR